MDTESIAVAEIKKAVARTDYLTDYIKDKEKEPMWDGAIYAYSSNKKKNSDWIGKASVQVKGKNVKNKNITELKYNLKIGDLKNYKVDGGVLFFVVAIDKGGETKIFYRALTPYLINCIITDGQGQKTIRACFFPFPEQPNEICNVVLDFIRDSKKQELFTHDNIPTLEEFIESAGKDISFGFQCSGIGYDRNKPYKYLFEHELYLYVKNTKLHIDFPMEHIEKIDKAGHSIKADVKIGDKEYYSKYDVVYKKNGVELHIGKSVVIDSDTLNNSAKIDYKLRGNIKEQIQDIQFIADFLSMKNVNINGVNFSINPNEEEIKSFHIEKALELQKKLINVDNLLASLGVKKPLNLEEISTKEYDYLKMLLLSLGEGKAISFEEKKVPPIGGVSIGNIYLLLYFRQNESGKYIIENLPDVEIDVWGENEEGLSFKTSKYAIMKADDIVKADNCTSEQIVNELMTIDNDGHYTNCNMVLLELLKAYDVTNKESFLVQAVRLAEWLKKAECLKGLSIVNYFQCLKRRGELSEEQENEIMGIIEDYNDNEELKVGAYILLDDYKMAHRCLNKLSPNTRDAFKEYPIYILFPQEKI